MPKAKIVPRPRKRSVADSVEFPRFILAAGVLVIGIILLFGALADASGKLSAPGIGSAIYMAVVVGIVIALIYVGRRWR
jgi:hypothetical protein